MAAMILGPDYAQKAVICISDLWLLQDIYGGKTVAMPDGVV